MSKRKEILDRIDKIFTYTCLSGIGLTMIVLAALPLQNRIVRNAGARLESFIQSDLGGIMEEQENKLGITHFGVPEVFSGFPAEWSGFETLGVSGTYEPSNDSIYLSPICHVEDHPDDKWIRLINCGRPHDARAVLAHELGHFYVDKLNESLGRDDFGSYDGVAVRDATPEHVGQKLIGEGISEYFRVAVTGGQDNFEDYEYPNHFEKFKSDKFFYGGGYHLVKPIIDLHGKRGIEYLIINPPATEQDFEDIIGYREKVLEALQNESIDGTQSSP